VSGRIRTTASLTTAYAVIALVAGLAGGVGSSSAASTVEYALGKVTAANPSMIANSIILLGPDAIRQIIFLGPDAIG
jgi:hypothetical protein